MSKVVLYGIPNCDTVKKARRWLDDQNIDYVFHNFKKDGVPEADLPSWVDNLGLDQLVNRRGTTWRKLDDNQKAVIEDGGAAALALIASESSMIKRPVLKAQDQMLVGFNVEQWEMLL